MFRPTWVIFGLNTCKNTSMPYKLLPVNILISIFKFNTLLQYALKFLLKSNYKQVMSRYIKGT